MQGKEAREELRLFGPAFDCEEVYDLYEQARVPCACAPDGLDQFAETRQKTIMPDAQQRPTRNVAHARRFDDNRARPAGSETPVPIEILARHKPVFGRAPRHHRGHPSALLKRQGADAERLKQERARGLCFSRPVRFKQFVSDGICGTPSPVSCSRPSSVTASPDRTDCKVQTRSVSPALRRKCLS